MKAKHIVICLMGFITLLSATSCEDRLDIPKHGDMGGQEEGYQTDEDALRALANLYNAWGGVYYNWFMISNLLSDDVYCGGGSRGDNLEMEQLNEFSFNTDNTMVRDLYSGLYTIVYNANLILTFMEPDTAAKQRAVAEAHFFRAWAHFQLVTYYGTAPKVDHLLGSDEYRKSNSKPEDLWSFIEQDLNEAIDMDILPSKSNKEDAETGIRITREVAQAMLGKTYVFQQKWDEAAEILDKVIASDKYDLYQGELDKLLHAECNGSCESMLEVQKRNDPEQTWTQFTMTYLMIGWRTSMFNDPTGAAKDEIAWGTYGFMNPRKEVYDAFVEREGAGGYRLNSTLRTYDQMVDYGITIKPGETLIGHEGYFLWKNRALKSDCIIDASYFQGFQYINLRVMRYAEVLLLAAEAHVQSGDKKGLAKEYVNRIRSRAQLAPLAAVTMDDVKKEKRLELFMECVRFQDLVRWGDAEQALAQQGKEIPGYTTKGRETIASNSNYGFQPKHKLLPIPQKELQVNPNMHQNDLW